MSTTVVKERQGSRIIILHDQNKSSTAAVDANPSKSPQKKKKISLAGTLDQLYDSEKKHNVGIREAALGAMMYALTRMPAGPVDEEFVEANRVSLVYSCLRVMGKSKRSSSEIVAAAISIGLVAMILNNVVAAHDLLCFSAPELFEAAVRLKGGGSSKWKAAAGKVVECSAVVTFFGAYLSEHRLDSMAKISSYFPEDSGDPGFNLGKKHPPELVASAISSWCFVLTNNHYGIGRINWRTKLPVFLGLLDHDNDSLAIAAAEALALIFEIESRYKTAEVSDIDNNVAAGEACFSEQGKNDIVKKLEERKLAVEETDSEEGNKMATRLAFVIKRFKEGCKGMTMGACAERLQLTFLERFLGEEAFAEHIKVNKKLQGMFKVKNDVKKLKKAAATAKKQPSEAEREDVKSRFYQPKLTWIVVDGSPFFNTTKERLLHKRLTKSPNSWWSKVNTQHRKQQRLVASNDRCKNVCHDSD
ncbi:hypothetical protein LINGRAHAP2_LOCUS19255 [Linum grandiflorum]